MTEAEWLVCPDPAALLRFAHPRAAPRRLRLFAIACYRRVWHRLGEAQRQVVRLAERCVESPPSSAPLSAEEIDWLAGMPYFLEDAFLAACHASEKACWALVDHAHWQGKSTRRDLRDAYLTEKPQQSELLRCILGNPFRPRALDPGWLTWSDGTVDHLARAIREERRFADLPVLADALEDAGCESRELLAHCRQPGGHAPGCWALDLLLKAT